MTKLSASCRNLTPPLCAVAGLCVAFAFAPAAAQDGAREAMRAPLNIVPPAMQQALQARPTAVGPSEKLAPRVAARQSKRAVRAVSAAPGSAGEIVQVGQLGALQDAPIGLEEGFGNNLWRGARLAFITGQMARLPERIHMAGLRGGELTLYRSTTASPVGTVDGTSWYAARLNRFLALDDTASVLQLEALTGGAAADAYAARAIALAQLGRGSAAAACDLPRPQRRARGHGDTLPFFMQLLVFCQLRAGEFEKAGLTLQLNDKTLGADKFFRELAFLMAAQAQPVFGSLADVDAAKAAEEEPPLVVPSEVTPMQLALLQLAGYGLDVPLDKLPPYFMGALAEDYAQPVTTQIGAAHLAMRAGSLSPERFSQLSQLADFSAYQTEGAADTAASPTGQFIGFNMIDMSDAVFLATTLLTVDMSAPENQGRAVADALRDAADRGLWRDMVLALQDRLTALAVPLIGSAGDPQKTLTDTAQEAQAVFDTPKLETESSDAAQAVPEFSENDRAVLLTALLALENAEQDITALIDNAPTLSANPLVARLASLSVGLSFGSDDFAAAPDFEAASDDPIADLLASLPAALPPDVPSEDSAQAGLEQTGSASGAEATGLLTQDTRVQPVADWLAFEAAFEAAGPALQRYLTREVAVYQGLEFAVPVSFQLAQTGADAPAAGQQRIDKLAENQWTGDLLLALVNRHAAIAADAMTPEAIVSLLQTLRRAGLQPLAAELGAEILQAAAARLSVTAPASFAIDVSDPQAAVN